ncbi:hypothetical protein [Streptomyces sp. TLI_146]|uniref:hypothetical protein n=1 Tax=Streptomyces sp. TLI_146 TaxID=1938858 RepID=UPI000C70C30D|nr:hypothetical protein [Streptomyces sp. TLI_146]PKV84287.1 hypothetical protein BX283_1801 [Streptomyces sp. TLI_146]
MPDDADDVMGVITEQIEARFQMPLADLRRAVAAAPHANDDATVVVKWYGMLAEAQEALNKVEDALVAALGSAPDDVLGDPVMALADRVKTAVAVRDGRAMVVRHYTDPNSLGRRGPGAWRGAEAASRRGPALQTAPAPSAPAPSVPVRGAVR